MILVEGVPQLRQIITEAKNKGLTIGFVPTMGYLHEGHGSLISIAKQQCDFVVLSIFVNPLQFGPTEDFEDYPRDLEKDTQFAESLGADVLFHPSVEEVYPTYPQATTVQVAGITSKLCGAFRPGHFDGVATVVLKLFNMVQPDQAFFGLKDAQQIAVIEQMVRDLNLPVKIVPCPIVREEDGLAKSSRNVYLNPQEREEATILYKSLLRASQILEDGEQNPQNIIAEMSKMISTMSLAEIQYIELLSFPDLQELGSIEQNQSIIIALAVKFGRTRLIDNFIRF